MKMRQILIAATTSLLVASPAFAATGSYGEGGLWTDIVADVAAYSQHSFPSATGKAEQAREGGLYEQLAADQRSLRQESAAGVAGPAGPALFAEEGHASAYLLRTDASLYERIIAAQGGLAAF